MKNQIYLFMIGILLFNRALAQPPSTKKEENKLIARDSLELPEPMPIKFRFSTMAGVNFSSAGHLVSDAANSSYDQTFKSTFFDFKPCLDYFFTPKIGAGISYNYFEHKMH